MSLFITFEGPEGCGKSTHAQLLKEFLLENNFKVKITREPGGTNIGKQIREVLLSPENKNLSPLAEFFLLLADRNQNVSENILPFLEQDYIVISDRFIDSSIAYQHGGRNIDIELINNLNNIATYNLKPDITFLLINNNVEEALEKARTSSNNTDRFENESLNFHKKIHDIYLKLSKTEERIKLITIYDSIQETQKIIRKYVANILNIEEGAE